MLDFVNICREERCPIDELHPVHGRIQRVHRGSFTVETAPEMSQGEAVFLESVCKEQRRRLLMDVTLKTISTRVLKPFGAIYTDVLDDYGAISESAVYRALADCCDIREVAAVVSPGMIDRLRRGGFARAGYIRYDSPLLWQRDGLASLMDQASEFNQDLVDASTSGERARSLKTLRGLRGKATARVESLVAV